jgi:hypothetical protein
VTKFKAVSLNYWNSAPSVPQVCPSEKTKKKTREKEFDQVLKKTKAENMESAKGELST